MSNEDKTSAIADGSALAGDGAKNSTSPTLETAQASPVAVGEVERAPERIWIDEWERAAKRTVGSYFFVPFNESSVDREDIAEIESVEYVRADLAALSRQPAPGMAEAMLGIVKGVMDEAYATANPSDFTMGERHAGRSILEQCEALSSDEIESQPAPVVTATHYPEVVRIITGAISGDMQKVVNYANFLADKVEQDGDIATADCIRKVVSGNTGAQIVAHESSAAASPVDSPAVDVREARRRVCQEAINEIGALTLPDNPAKMRTQAIMILVALRDAESTAPTAQADDLRERVLERVAYAVAEKCIEFDHESGIGHILRQELHARNSESTTRERVAHVFTSVIQNAIAEAEFQSGAGVAPTVEGGEQNSDEG